MLLAFLISLFYLLTTSLAAPAVLESATSTPSSLNPATSFSTFRTLVPDPGTQNCLSEKHGLGSTTRVCYTITIAAPYDDGKGCDGVHYRVDKATRGRLNHKTWECTGESGDENIDYTRLYFCLLGSKDVSEMNVALGDYYPMINGFNCPKD